MSQTNVIPVFFTVSNDNGERNPRSLLMIESLQGSFLQDQKKNKWSAIALSAPSEIEMIDVALSLEGLKGLHVAVFDAEINVNHWRPQRNTARETPAWARFTGWGVRIGQRGVATQASTDRCTRQIGIFFNRSELLAKALECALMSARAPQIMPKKKQKSREYGSLRPYGICW